MAVLIFRCRGCGEAVRTVNRPQYRRDQEVMTPLRCEYCKSGRAKPTAVKA